MSPRDRRRRERDLRIIRLIAEGRTNREIAEAMCYSDRHVNNLVATICRERGVPRRSGLALVAIRRGELVP